MNQIYVKRSCTTLPTLFRFKFPRYRETCHEPKPGPGYLNGDLPNRRLVKIF